MKKIARNLFTILLIGCLSMLSAEVFSGSSQVWYTSGWGVLLTLPLYLAHVLFFLWLACKLKKTSLPQLYFFGMMFALYESWITKVLWAGYMNATGPGLAIVLGVSIPEYPILVFFWHPIMAFILPILAFEVLTGKTLAGHDCILMKSTRKTVFIIICLVLTSTLIASGNKYDILSCNLSLIGTLLIVSVLYYLSRKTELDLFKFPKTGFIIVTAYLILLYVATFFAFLPERIPQTALPYILIISSYVVVIWLIRKSKKIETELTVPSENQYGVRDLALFALITVLAVNLAVIVPKISAVILVFTYFLLLLAGILIFVMVIYKTLKQLFQLAK